MSKLILKLNEAGFLTNKDSDLVEVTNTLGKPDYSITDITVMSDEDYYPTIQNILIDLDENHQLNESQEVSKGLSINILSETVNQKTGYSNSLFEFESKDGVITLSLVLSESDKYDTRGVFNVSLYTTKGEKIYESNTSKPKAEIKKILNELSNKYLVSTTLNEAVLINNDDSKSISDKPKLDANEFEDVMTCVRGVLDGTALTDDFDASVTLYVDKSGNKYKVSKKQSKNTQAIITPERNVYMLNLTEITNQDDTKELANPDKGNAKAPKVLKTIETKPEEIKESNGGSDQWTNSGKVILNGKEMKDYLRVGCGGKFPEYEKQIDDEDALYQLTDLDKGRFEFKKLGNLVNESEDSVSKLISEVNALNSKGLSRGKVKKALSDLVDSNFHWYKADPDDDYEFSGHFSINDKDYEFCIDFEDNVYVELRNEDGEVLNEAEEQSFNKARFVFGVNNLADLQDKLAKQLTTKSLYNVVDEIKVSDADYEKISTDFTTLTNLLDSTETPKDTDTLSVFRITTEAGDRPILLVSTDLKYFGIDYSNLPKETSEDEV